MKRYFSVAAGLATAVAIGAAGAAGAPHADAAGRVHFATPQAAMRYLAAASNRDNVTDIHHVTTPASFKQFMSMRPEMHNLKAQSCHATGHGDYLCNLGYQYREGKHTESAVAQVIVAPAINPGWYMYAMVTCGG